MIRVLHVVNSFGLGGSETQLLRILRDYDRSHFSIDVCTIGSEADQPSRLAADLKAEVLSCPKSVNLISFSPRANRILGFVHANVLNYCNVKFFLILCKRNTKIECKNYDFSFTILHVTYS